MSRRKQPNPKHAKRESDLEELACLVNLPTDLVYVKESASKEEEEEEAEEEEDSENSSHSQLVRYTVFAKKDLKADTVIATYKGHIKDTSKEQDSANAGNVLKLKCSEGGSFVHVMIEDEGCWLKLIRTATPTSKANICLRISCGDVVCRVVKDVTRDVELRITCEISDRSLDDKVPDCCAFNPPHLPNLKEEPDNESSNAVSEIDAIPRRSSDMLDTFVEVSHSLELSCETTSTNADDDFPRDIAIKCENDPLQSYDSTVALSYGTQMSEEVVSPSSDHEDHEAMNHRITERKNKEMKSSKSSSHVSSFDADESSSLSPNTEFNETSTTNTEQLFECPSCSFQTYRHHILTKHVKLHHTSSAKAKFSNDLGSSASAYCSECSIQFMSANTYRVHKEFYCKSRHDPSIADARQFQVINDIHPRDDVFILGKKHLGGRAFSPNNGIVPNVIQPQAIFAAISTDPLILLPCSLVNGQGLVPQSGLVSTGMPIVLPTGISSATIVENGAFSSIQRNQSRDKSNKCAPSSQTSHVANAIKSSNSDYSNDSTDKRDDEADVLNLVTTQERTSPKAKAEQTISQERPLDLTVRKRKTSCFEVQRHEPRPIVKRRNSFASVSPTTPPAQFSPPLHSKITHSSSPEPYSSHYLQNNQASLLVPQVIAVSPPTFSNDASNSSGYGTTAVSAMAISDVHGLCKIQDGSSPAPPVLLSVLESTSNSSTQRGTAIPLSLPPPKLLKQGNNRCEDCNIVFYKYDNYLAHKKHYCAYRRRQLANQQKEENARAASDVSTSDENSGNASQTETKKYDEKVTVKSSNHHLDFALENLITVQPTIVNKPLHSAVFRCDACGVKFSTADNLNAHQTYYCSRKADFSYAKYNSPPRKNSISRGETSQLSRCPSCGESGDGHDELCCPEEWKCNYCDVVCPSLKSARRHLLTHSEIRGFCCIVCGYRGNTLRGMRSHVYEHLNGDASQIEDILASSVVVDPSSSGRRTADFSGDEETNYSVRETKPVIEEDRIKDTHSTMVVCKIESLRDNCADRSISPQHTTTHTSAASPDAAAPEQTDDSPSTKITPHAEQEKHRSEKLTDEDSDGSESYHHRNHGVMCDVLIKTEAEDFPCSPEKIVPERENTSPSPEGCSVAYPIKSNPYSSGDEKKRDEEEDEEIDVEEEETDKPDDKPKIVVASGATSVICRVPSSREVDPATLEVSEKSPNNHTPLPKKRKLKTNVKSGLELKYCKSCDISFHHLSNFIAHKKFYCVSRVLESFQQEAAPVQ